MTIRELPSEEFYKLEGHKALKGLVPDPTTSKIIVAENEAGEIVGFWFMVQVVHLEPIWIAPEYRSGLIAGRMWKVMRVLLDSLRINVGFMFADRSDIAEYIPRLGCRELPYRTFLYDPHGIYPKE